MIADGFRATNPIELKKSEVIGYWLLVISYWLFTGEEQYSI